MLMFRCFVAQSSMNREIFCRILVGLRLAILVAAALVLLAGCDHDNDDDEEDDYIVSFPPSSSFSAIDIRRSFDQPFDVIEIGVTPIIGPEPYLLTVKGIAWVNGATIVFEDDDIVSRAFIDPLGDRVIDVLINCDCFVDYVILRSEFGDTTLAFD